MAHDHWVSDLYRQDTIRFAAALAGRLVEWGRDGQFRASRKAPDVVAYDAEAAPAVAAVRRLLADLGVDLPVTFVQSPTGAINDLLYDRFNTQHGFHTRRSPEVFEAAHAALREIAAQLPADHKRKTFWLLAVQGVFDPDLPFSLEGLPSETVKVRPNSRVKIAGLSWLGRRPYAPPDLSTLSQVILDSPEQILAQIGERPPPTVALGPAAAPRQEALPADILAELLAFNEKAAHELAIRTSGGRLVARPDRPALLLLTREGRVAAAGLLRAIIPELQRQGIDTPPTVTAPFGYVLEDLRIRRESILSVREWFVSAGAPPELHRARRQAEKILRNAGPAPRVLVVDSWAFLGVGSPEDVSAELADEFIHLLAPDAVVTWLPVFPFQAYDWQSSIAGAAWRDQLLARRYNTPGVTVDHKRLRGVDGCTSRALAAATRENLPPLLTP